MKQQMLASEKYPEIVFDATGASAAKPGEFRYRFRLRSWAADCGPRASLRYGRAIYEISSVRVADGALKLKDELKFAFDIVSQTRE